jgi:hypothetical protein
MYLNDVKDDVTVRWFWATEEKRRDPSLAST